MLSCVCLAACADAPGDGHPSQGSGVDRSQALATLSALEQPRFCDWLNLAQGGYGKQQTCEDGTYERTDVDQASCIQGLAGLRAACMSVSASCFCSLSVAQAEDCARASGADLCRYRTARQCQPLYTCLR